jgi:hypothetical protein
VASSGPNGPSPVAGGTLRRLVWLAFGAALIGFAIYEVVVHDLGPLPIVAFALLPDLTFLAGAGQPHRPGQLPPRAVPLYNLAHRPVIPALLIVATLVVLVAIRLPASTPEDFEAARHVPLIAYVAGLTWLAHIALDRAFGFGLRTPDGWQRSSPGVR